MVEYQVPEKVEVLIQEGRIDSPPLKILVNEKITSLYGWTAETLAAPVAADDYGIRFPPNVGQFFKEAHCYRHSAGLDKLFHMINMIKLDLPFFQFTNLGYINSNALRVLKALCDHNDLGIAGAASTGKTYPVAAYILEDWKSAPDETLSFVCTVSIDSSYNRIWGAIVNLWQHSSYKVGNYIPHKHVIAWGNFSDSAQDRDFNSAIKALAVEKGEEGRKAIDTTRGRKQKNVRLVFDELPEMETYVTLAAINLESNTADVPSNAFGLQVVGIGNPANPNDAHGGMCKPDHPLGFKSISKNTPEWKTRTGWCIFLSGEWSPNFEVPPGEPLPFPRLTNRVGLERMLIRCHGNPESLEFYRNAIGFWADSNIVQTVLTPEIIQSKHATGKAEWKTVIRKRICGFDIGFTAGGDKCVAQFGEIGIEHSGNRKIVNWLDEKVYMVATGGIFEDEIARQVVDDCIAYGVAPDGFGMDISGDGGKMLQAIIRYWIKINPAATDIFAISSMGKPTDRMVSNVDPRKCSDAFDRRVTEYWMMVREAVLCEVIRGMPLYRNGTEMHPIAEQLCARIYTIRGKKFCIETKPEMKDRLSGNSPDEADAFVYMIEMARRHGLVFQTPDDLKRKDNRKNLSLTRERPPAVDYGSDDWGEDEEAA